MTVVVAFSSDQYGDAALTAGIQLAKEGNEKLVVVNGTKGDAYVDSRFAKADQVEALERQVAEAGVELDLRHEVVTNIADAVIAAATDSGARLIVVGVRHRSAVGKAIMGSVAQQVILDSPVPVLSVKP